MRSGSTKLRACALGCIAALVACGQTGGNDNTGTPFPGTSSTPNTPTGAPGPVPMPAPGAASAASAGSAGAPAAASDGANDGTPTAGSAADAPTAGSSAQEASTTDGGTPGEPGMGMEKPPRPDQGEGDGKDVIAIGDSWMSLTLGSGIEYSLVKASGNRPYRLYGVAGVEMLKANLFGAPVPQQYENAKTADADIKTVVMTGGGNDIIQNGLQTDCANGGSMCAAKLMEVGVKLHDLWYEMADDGVTDVIYVLYAKSAGSGVKEDPARTQALIDLCDGVPEPLRCHLLPTDDLVNGELMLDGIHPSAAAYDRIGAAVYDLMVSEGMRR